MIARPSPASLAWLLFATCAQAQYVIEAASFGHKGTISPNGRAIPGWHLTGENHVPHLLSDRIILTPPSGSTRGALWADASITQPDWSAEVEFRASGQERGSGNLQVWFVKGGREAVGHSGVYTVGKFDGLALIVDQYGGRGGGIRGFLNDGSVSFKDHHAIDSLAFGHCDYSYRNLGRPSRLRIENGHNGLKVEIDGNICFSSDKVSLPPGYYFGLSSATSENPDSFEINKFVVSTTSSIAREEPQKRPQLEKLDRLPSAPEQLPDTDASSIKSQDEQFADLHNRLQGMTHQIANIFGEFDRLARTLDQRHNELLNSRSSDSGSAQQPPPPPPAAAPNNDALVSLSRRLENIERVVQTIQKDVEGKDYREHFDSLQQAVAGVQGGLSEHLPNTITQIISTSAPNMSRFIFVIIAFQVMLVGAYIVYKKRRANAPKKYL
ncbi:hypothetical protein MBLNU459_g2999t1 [Dothideomycetes sp. NU459]